jgi:hypothetical protein
MCPTQPNTAAKSSESSESKAGGVALPGALHCQPVTVGPLPSFLSKWLLLAALSSLPVTAVPGLLAQAPARPVASVFLDPQIHRDPVFPREVAQMVESAGFAVRFLTALDLTNTATLTPQDCALLVLPQGRSLPMAAAGPIRRFLQAGGNLLALGAPLWETPLHRFQDRWLSRAEYDQALSEVRPEQPLFSLDAADTGQWVRSTPNPQRPFRRETEATPQGPALHVRTSTTFGWETLAAPPLETPFPAGHTLTCFRARGGAQTKQLSIEWAERDGSRWIAVVELGPEWRQYALPPAAFQPWTPPAGRGFAGDSLHVAQARRLTIGLAESHGANMRGTNEYWISGLGTAPNPFAGFEPAASVEVPRLEALCPGYLFFPITTPVELSIPRPVGQEAILPARAGLAPLLALHPRPAGAGFDQGRPWRWQPLLEARTANGDYRGAVAVLVARATGGTLAVFTPEEPAFYRQDEIRGTVRQAAEQIRQGLHLVEGGAEFFTLFTNQPVRLGARVMNQGATPAPSLTVRITVTPAEARGPAVLTFQAAVAPGPRAAQTVETNWLARDWPAGGYRVEVALLEGKRVIDRLAHELHVWQPRAQPRYIEARAGGFWLDGRPWKAHGVNYMPSSGIGVDGEYFEYWVGKGAYDPVVIERDLRRVKAMNLNAVSVFAYHRSLGAQHLLDFLRRCEALELRVNLSLRPGTPLDFRWREMKELIDYYRLAWHDTVFAYDLAWEPSHYDQAYQERHYARPWQEWVLKRYGSREAAEKAWNTAAVGAGAAQRVGEQTPSVPPMAWLGQDGPWRKMVADYRRFLDELLGPAYAEARRLVRTLDSRHPVSFRMQLAGDPTHTTSPLPYDFYGLAGAVDIWEPEAYGRIGDWERVKPGHFTAAYARLCDPDKPVLWAEMGNTVWDPRTMAPSPQKIEATARFYEDFYRMMTSSGADGVFFWWYPGGYRSNERSDFGILNPDGTERAITRVIRTEGPRFLAAAKPPAPDHWISVDRDRDARGLPGIYEKAQAEYWQALAEGKVPGLRWARRPGE